MFPTLALIARRKASRVVFLLGAPVVLFWSLGMVFERLFAQRVPALTVGSWGGVSVAVGAFAALVGLAAVLATSGRWWAALRVPARIRAFWLGLTFFRSTLLGYFVAAPLVLLLGSLLTAGAEPRDGRSMALVLVTFWWPLWWAPALGALMTGWRLGRLYRRA
jgi:hypothetical protein